MDEEGLLCMGEPLDKWSKQEVFAAPTENPPSWVTLRQALLGRLQLIGRTTLVYVLVGILWIGIGWYCGYYQADAGSSPIAHCLVLLAISGGGGYMITKKYEVIRSSSRARFCDEQDRVSFSQESLVTGLASRSVFLEEFQTWIDEVCGGFGAVVWLDVDDLKQVNDAFGHRCGDAVICAVASNLSGASEEYWNIHLGGDEFLVGIPLRGRHEDASVHVARILQSVNGRYVVGDMQLHITTRAGYAVYPDHGRMPEELLKKAYGTLQSAKHKGKNGSCCFDAWMQHDAVERVRMLNGLRRAIDDRELQLHFQPQVTSREQRVVGFEALLRWENADFGAVSPREFIPLAEKSGLILPIGRWVLREACRFAASLRTKGYEGVAVSVNISPRQICDDSFLEDVRTAIREAGIDAAQLELEITETMLMPALEECRSKLTTLHEWGISLALDDFGVGYSSLMYLLQLPVKTIKIDKAFIDRVPAAKDEYILLESIIHLAHKQGMDVVAEGVEMETQVAALQMANCNRVQGYYFSRPLPEDAAIAFLSRNVV